ncbi:double-strand break repair protein AddB [Phaeobacter sp. CNT1-3]|nr:double-strand break repair protein AddB [Phaeobacter sp. CNT1-3]
MFKPSDRPRVYGVPSGADFPKTLVQGLMAHADPAQPEALANAHVLVNSTRMARRVRQVFDAGPALLLPRLGLVTDPARTLDSARALPDLPDAVSPLRRRLELTQLVSQLLDSQPDLAPRASLYDLSDSLAALLDEMHGEGVDPDTLRQLDVSDESGHWQRALSFLDIVQHYFSDTLEAPDKETRARMMVNALADHWTAAPPEHPLIIAGSTGSRGTTMLLMKAVAKLPQGAIVLPGFDFDMSPQGWADLKDALTSEDHPQYRYAKLLDELDLTPQEVEPWHGYDAPSVARNKLVSLALRPAPVTDQWLEEGPKLEHLADAFANVTLVEAQSQRDEALAIALRLRQAAEEGTTAALITPDRMLTRQVSAALSRWNITPDDSAGIPLQLTAPGRFLRHVSALFHRKLTSEALLVLLMHPLCHTGGARGQHLLLTRELELMIRRRGMPFPDAEVLRAWAIARDEEMAEPWVNWIIACFLNRDEGGKQMLAQHLDAHLTLAEQIAAGCAPEHDSELWQEQPGRAARATVDRLLEDADAGGELSPLDYADLFGAVLSQGELRNPDEPHPNILIWGTLEARVQGADLVILGGLNEAAWPEMPSPDPWLNRKMRHDAGLLLPERRIGLSAHDFQQAIGAPEVWLTRSVRSDDAETVPSRWLNRMVNLMTGLPEQGGVEALNTARTRGQNWLAMARKLEEPGKTAPAPRPSPRPPVASRPRQLSVTEIQRLIRDPYAIYAKHVLRLRPLDPLMRAPDALLRGIVTHTVLEQFIDDTQADPAHMTADHLRSLTGAVLAENVPWPDTRTLWEARIHRIADWFVATEVERRKRATPTYFEEKGELRLKDQDFTLTARADRIDIDDMGRAHIYDYKTGTPPTAKAQIAFNKQLLLEAAMVSQGAFEKLGFADVSRALFIGLGAKPAEVYAPLDDEPVERVWEKFEKLITRYFDPAQGYTARRALFKDDDFAEYDQLSRFGEWDVTSTSEAETLS